MDIEKITKIAFKKMAKRKAHLEREKGYIFYHCQRVAKLAINLRKSIHPSDDSFDDIIYVGSLFHDVTKGIEPHNESGSILVKEILKDYCSIEEIQMISEIVRLHNQRGNDNLPYYLKIVQDADVLDHFGSGEIWLKFFYSAHHEENVFEALETWNSTWFKDYYKKTRDSLNFDLSKEIFDNKADFHNKFVERFAMEINGEISI
ncbi:HD domain-containing protein [Bacillus sp. RG28]|uniref:HD domain-containing protein n=1 Tax=Gottfriedia endophytica TaxID=2820819 RepID=A0A940NHX0_9BACI|nr:HD domain-containing protein [Gottfriedia endophytica]MBP0725694.1 HD domain-containing protein [Gottfriedia endophytica]